MTSNNDVRTHERDASANIAAALGADVSSRCKTRSRSSPGI